MLPFFLILFLVYGWLSYFKNCARSTNFLLLTLLNLPYLAADVVGEAETRCTDSIDLYVVVEPIEHTLEIF